MFKFKKIKYSSFLILLCSTILFPNARPIFGQVTETPTTLERVTIGPHPEYSRVLLHLSDPVKYEIKADFMKRRVTLILSNTVLGNGARSRIFKDRNLEQINLYQRQHIDTVNVTLQLKNRNSRFFHYLKLSPDQIVVDVKGLNRPIMKTKVRLPIKQSLQISDLTRADLAETLVKDRQSKVEEGWEDYINALKTFQDKKYPEAVELFNQFQKQHLKSKYLEHVAYLKAQGELNVELKKKQRVFERPLESFRFALRKFPDSQFASHAKTRLAKIYADMGMLLEAKTLYKQRLEKDPEGLFANFVRAQLALLMIKENRYGEAYESLRNILKKLPNDMEARRGIIKVAEWYYDQENFPKAIKIFEYIKHQAHKENPKRLQERYWQQLIARYPEIDFYMGEIYFRNKNFKRARNHYFDLINLDPQSPLAYRSRNRIGDSYFIEGNDRASLSVFDESVKANKDNRESQYGLIRMADIGVRNPNLEIKNISIDVDPYFNPFKTYKAVIQGAKDNNIMAEALLSRGIAYLRSQRYINAMEQFKLLLAKKPAPNFVHAGKKYMKQSLILLADKFSSQKANLPILYAYGDYLGMGIGDINNVKTVLQVGEAYQKIGMYQEAVHHYERVKLLDTRKIYSDRIFLNLGRIHQVQGSYKNAERISKVFINRFPKSGLLTEAKELMAESYKGQGLLEDATNTYKGILKEKLDDPSRIYFNIAEIHRKNNQLDKAATAYGETIATYDRKIQPTPEHVGNAYYLYASTLYKNKEFSKSIEALKRARELFPDHPSRSWADFLLTEAYDAVKNPTQLTAEIKEILKSAEKDDLFKKVAQTKLKMMDWEKKFKEVL